MYLFIDMIAQFWRSLFDLLNSVVLDYAGIEVSLGALIFVPLVVGMVVTIFWKGSKT